MHPNFSSISFEKPQTMRSQIADRMRELLGSGKLSPGEKIPSTSALAKTWSTDVCTVHAALTTLQKEGLLARYPGKGTFVQKREERLTKVGIYYDHHTFGNGKSLFLQSLNMALKTELDIRGIEMDTWIDPRPTEQTGAPWAPFAKAAENRSFQALIVPGTNRELLRWQTRLPVPTAFLTGEAGIPNRVNTDEKQFIDIGLRALSEQGCRSVGMIAPWATCEPYNRFFSHFTDVSRALGLTVKNEWMRLAPDPGAMHRPGQAYDYFGYQEFLALWSYPDRPEGLIVLDDVVARGVIAALLEKSVPVPRELKLVLQKNEAINYLCPMPVTFAVGSEREIARALVDQVEKQFRGESCEPISLPFKLVAHNY